MSSAKFEPGKPCPKCAYVRTPADANPAWQCPKCEIAYVKFRPTASPIAARVVDGGREIAMEAKTDASTWSLVVANLLALAIAAATGMTLRDLVIVYWVQSLVIGVSFSIRILFLRPGTVTRLLPDGNHVALTSSQKVSTAFGVLLGFIGLHLLYAVHIFSEPGKAPSVTGTLLCALVFVANHGYSMIRNIRLDRRDQLRLGTLLSIPFLRIVPMHVLAVVGVGISPTGTGFWGLLFFTSLKTGADVVSHVIEHHELRMGSSLRWLRDAHFEREMQLEAQRMRERTRS